MLFIKTAQRAIRPLILWLLLMLCAGSVLVKPAPASASAAQAGSNTIYLPFVIRSEPAWLAYINAQRTASGLPRLIQNADWNTGAYNHARYMVKNNIPAAHEETGLPYYTPEGDTAAASSNLLVAYDVNTTDQYALETWLTGPFHAVTLLDPKLAQTGFGSYREADDGLQMGAVLDVIRGRLSSVPPGVTYPVMWPGNGATLTLTSVFSYTSPSPLTHYDAKSDCRGYAGLPVILQLGANTHTGIQLASTNPTYFWRGSSPQEHCWFTESNYYNPDPTLQGYGRATLDIRDAIVLIPRYPLVAGETYTVSMTLADNTNHTWSFQIAP